mgnify:CR=1 FL=1
MTDKHEEQDIDIAEKLNEGRQFFEKFQKEISIGVGVFVALTAGIGYYLYSYIPTLEKEAQAEIFYAQGHFANDSFNLAMYGDNMGHFGFADIIDNYGGTKSADLSNYYMGVCLMRTGDYEGAIDYLSDFGGNDKIVSSVALGAIGDCYSELQNDGKAFDYYMKAAKNNENDFSTPLYLMKAGNISEALGDYDNAISAYEKIARDFPNSTEGREVKKYLARAKAMQGS